MTGADHGYFVQLDGGVLDEHAQSINQFLHGALKGSEEGLSAPGFPVAVPFPVLLVVVCSISTYHRRYSLASERRLAAGFV